MLIGLRVAWVCKVRQPTTDSRQYTRRVREVPKIVTTGRCFVSFKIIVNGRKRMDERAEGGDNKE
jgi:hypothetical protein